MKNEWFEDVFLPSFGEGRNTLSAKQLQICKENMVFCEDHYEFHTTDATYTLKFDFLYRKDNNDE